MTKPVLFVACWLAIGTLLALPLSGAGQSAISTAGKNVVVFPQVLSMGIGNRMVTIRIYRPHHLKDIRLPVLYMLDGQNLFDESTSYAGEWQVDEMLDSTGIPIMVVGIDHAGTNRFGEYSVADHPQYGKAYGPNFLKWLADTLKPWVEKRYSVQTERECTWIAGSSMGGIISTYAIGAMAKSFGGAGIFSPGYELYSSVENPFPIADTAYKTAVWMYAGGRESKKMIPLALAMAEKLSTSAALTEMHTDASQGHNEKAWRLWFPSFIKFMMLALQEWNAPKK